MPEPETPFYVRVYLDEQWHSMKHTASEGCSSRSVSKSAIRARVPVYSGEWSGWVQSTVSQSVRPHLWYFVAEDCDGATDKEKSKYLDQEQKIDVVTANTITKAFYGTIEFEGILVQPNGSHHSYEQLRTGKWVVLQLISYAACAFVLFKMESKEMKSVGSLHPYIQGLNVVVVFQAVAAFFHLLHLWVYHGNGRGIVILNAFSQFIGLLAQISVSTILNFIALGYGLEMGKTAQKGQAMGLALPVTVVITLLQAIILFINKLLADQRHVYHDMDGWLGWVVIALRLGLYCGFLAGWQGTYREAIAQKKYKLLGFLRQLLAAGTLYFLGLPLIFLFVEVFAPYLQHTALTQMVFAIQLLAIVWLGSLFLLKGVFSEISVMGRSFLPGGYLQLQGGGRSD